MGLKAIYGVRQIDHQKAQLMDKVYQTKGYAVSLSLFFFYKYLDIVTDWTESKPTDEDSEQVKLMCDHIWLIGTVVKSL